MEFGMINLFGAGIVIGVVRLGWMEADLDIPKNLEVENIFTIRMKIILEDKI